MLLSRYKHTEKASITRGTTCRDNISYLTYTHVPGTHSGSLASGDDYSRDVHAPPRSLDSRSLAVRGGRDRAPALCGASREATPRHLETATPRGPGDLETSRRRRPEGTAAAALCHAPTIARRDTPARRISRDPPPAPRPPRRGEKGRSLARPAVPLAPGLRRRDPGGGQTGERTTLRPTRTTRRPARQPPARGRPSRVRT